MVRPVEGMRVLDLTRFVAGPYVTMALAALGADVIKLEVPPNGDPYRHQGTAFVGDEAALFLCLNSGKRSVALDFRDERAADVVARLVRSAEVVVQNARPGALDAYGLGPEHVRAVNPRAVYASISGYGETGPQASRGGFDLILQAEGGIMGVTGTPDGPPVALGAPLIDIGAGMSCLAAIFAALLERERSGVGSCVSSSLLEHSLAGLTTLIANHRVNGEVPTVSGGHSPMFAPYGAFRARDGYLVLAGAGSEHLWLKLCEVVGRPDLGDDPRFATNADRVRRRDDLVAELESALERRDAADWVASLEAAGVPAGQVAKLDQLVESPQIQALGSLRTIQHPDVGSYPATAFPLRVDGEALVPSGPAPALGGDSRDVLVELGVEAAEIDALVEAGVLAEPAAAKPAGSAPLGAAR